MTQEQKDQEARREDALREQEVKRKEFGPYAGVDQEGHYSHSEAAQQERAPMQEKEVESD